jgi:monoterpene epsilon-lactone hydrolase
MPSWQARCLTLAVRVYMRRATWGDERALVARARRVFGPPRPWRWLRARRVRISPLRDDRIRGEWIAADRSERGVVLYVHGGGYVACSAATHRPITAGLARRAHRRILALDYRLAPEHRFPAALDDTVAAYRWLLDQGVSARSLALAGDSAGGGLVLATLVRLRDEGLSLPACAVCFSPWTDLAGTGPSLHLNDGRDALLHAENIADFARAYLGAASPLHPHASPVVADLRGLPPLLLQVASSEVLLDDALRVHDKVREAGGVSRLDVVDGVFHAWQMLDGLMPEASLALQRAASFMNEPASRPTTEMGGPASPAAQSDR